MKLRHSHFLSALAAVLLLAPLAACSTGTSGNSDAGSSTPDGASSENGSFSEMDVAQDPSAVESDGVAPQAEPTLIQTGSISIEVSDPLEAADQTTKIVNDLGGQVASRTMNRSGEGGGATAQLTLRVPAEQFETTLTDLEEVGQVQSQNNSAVDVTAEYVDLQARVEALEASVDRLTELMSDSSSTSALLEAEAALSERQQDLDGLRAQLTALEDQVALATIEVDLNTRSAIPGGGPSNFWEGLVSGWDALIGAGAGALVMLGILLPWFALAALITLCVVLIVRYTSRKRRARIGRSVSPQPNQQPQQESAGAVQSSTQHSSETPQ